MAAGRTTMIAGQIPSVDTHTFTATSTPCPAYPVYWLAEAILYLLHSLGGPAPTVFAHNLIVSTAYILTLRLSHSLAHNWRMAADDTVVTTALGMSDWNVRAQASFSCLAPLFPPPIRAYR